MNQIPTACLVAFIGLSLAAVSFGWLLFDSHYCRAARLARRRLRARAAAMLEVRP